jgi:hypothetical protein
MSGEDVDGMGPESIDSGAHLTLSLTRLRHA